MAVTWNIKTELVNKDTELRKVTAIAVDTLQPDKTSSYFVKAHMKTIVEKNTVWDNLWNQYLKSTEIIVDAIADEGKANLDARITKETI